MQRGYGHEQAMTVMELTIVLGIIAGVGAFAVPSFIATEERSKACEAFSYLSQVKSAQERHRARHGAYASSLSDLNLTWAVPHYFVAGRIVPGKTRSLADSWRLTLTRSGAGGYGRYTVTFSEDGFDADSRRSSIAASPSINPMSR